MVPVIVTDIDEVVFNITPKWTKRIMHNTMLLQRIRNLEPVYAYNNSFEDLYKSTQERLEYDLCNWLQLPRVARALAFTLYADDEKFYHDLPLTKFGWNLLSGGKHRKIIFLSHILGRPCDDSKKEMIYHHFKNCDIEYYTLFNGFSKGDKINEVCPNFSVFIDDLPANLLDVMEKCGDEKKKFLFPLKGYNAHIVEDAEKLVKEKKLNLAVID